MADKETAPAKQLTSWLSRDAKGAYFIDTDKAYPLALQLMAAPIKVAVLNDNGEAVRDGDGNPTYKDAPPPGFETPELDQYKLECALQVVKMKAMEVIGDQDDDPNKIGRARVLMTKAADKDKWAIANYPEGRGARAATQGREARIHFDRVSRKLV